MYEIRHPVIHVCESSARVDRDNNIEKTTRQTTIQCHFMDCVEVSLDVTRIKHIIIKTKERVCLRQQF